MVKIGIIGGSGLDDPKMLKDTKELIIKTDFGQPSSPLTIGKIKEVEVVILARHGKKHTIMPTNVPYQANIAALKKLGCTHIIATTACGSLKEQIKPGEFIFIDQFIDRTTKRKSTFYEQDHVCHIPMAEPFCSNLRKTLVEQAKKLKFPHHEKGSVITIEGPRFSTKAESHLFRQWGADVINMSTVPEVVLAREAGIHYAAIAMATDYDCWRDTGERADIATVLKVFKENVDKVKKVMLETIPVIKQYSDCSCEKDIASAVMS